MMMLIICYHPPRCTNCTLVGISRSESDLAYLHKKWLGVCNADAIAYESPHLDRDCIQESFTAARKEEWFRVNREVQLAFCGYQTFSSNADLSHPSLVEADGYTPEASFGCCLKYTSLRSHRLAESTLDRDDNIFNQEAIEKACKSLVPHILCEYVFDLSKFFASYYREAGSLHA